MHLVASHLTTEHWPDVLRLCHPKIEPGSSTALEYERDWHDLWDHATVLGVAVVDFNEQPHLVRGLMVTAFITYEAYAAACESTVPQLLRRTIRGARAGEPVFEQESAFPVLNGSDGLVSLVCYVGWDGEDYTSENAARLRTVVTNAYAERHSGYRLRAVIGELGGDKLLDLTRRIQLGILNDYAGWALENGQLDAPKRPYLVGIERAEALQSENHWLMRLFTYFPPRFLFTSQQQEILLRAREGRTDSEVAEELEISLDAVKKRWSAIYIRANERMPGLLPESPEGGRGVEKRRAILQHLRDRPEELRPYQAKS